MSDNQERIAQFRKMAEALPDDDLAFYRLGSLLMEEKQYEEAIAAFQRTLELTPHFSKVFHLLGQCQVALGQTEAAVDTLTRGYAVADERGDNRPRDDMAKMLVELGRPAPVSKRGQPAAQADAAEGTFRCLRPTCVMGGKAHQLPAPPFNDDLGRRIQASICADCWNSWLRDFSIKVINELRLDLSREDHQAQYDRNMLEFLGLEESPAVGSTLPLA